MHVRLYCIDTSREIQFPLRIFCMKNECCTSFYVMSLTLIATVESTTVLVLASWLILVLIGAESVSMGVATETGFMYIIGSPTAGGLVFLV